MERAQEIERHSKGDRNDKIFLTLLIFPVNLRVYLVQPLVVVRLFCVLSAQRESHRASRRWKQACSPGKRVEQRDLHWKAYLVRKIDSCDSSLLGSSLHQRVLQPQSRERIHNDESSGQRCGDGCGGTIGRRTYIGKNEEIRESEA